MPVGHLRSSWISLILAVVAVFLVWNSPLHQVYAYSPPVKKANSSSHRVEHKTIKLPGDIILGGLFPIHNRGSGDHPCGGINPIRGVQRAEVMVFTVQEINNRSDILPGLDLGVHILDTCSRDTYALEQALEYVRASMRNDDQNEYECKDGSKPTMKDDASRSIAGVIGGSLSSVSIQVANLLRLFKIPQVSYASTSAALSDKTRFDIFARTLPPDTFQVKAMVDIVQFFNWTYVNTIASDDDYGESGIEYFIQESSARNICISVREKVPSTSNPGDYDQIIKNLVKKGTDARVVVLFVTIDDVPKILAASERQNMTDQFIWLASDGWGSSEEPVKDHLFAAEGAITLDLQTHKIPEFDHYFQTLHPATYSDNPWFEEYWEWLHDCALHQDNSTLPPCTGKEHVTRAVKYRQGIKTQFIYDAVYAMARALHAAYEDRCPGMASFKGCKYLHTLDGKELFDNYLLNVSFNDGYGVTVQFDQQGDAAGRYNIKNFQRNRETGRYDYRTVGSWKNGGLQMDPNNMVWAGGTDQIPKSRCSEPCLVDEARHPHASQSCCWVCVKCARHEYLRDEFTCEDCGIGFWPKEDRKTCYPLEEQYMHWDSLFAIVPIILSCLGIMVTLVVIYTFLKHKDTPIVKASGRELCYMLLSGCLCCYLMSFVLLAKPSTLSCAVQRFGVGLGFSAVYASLLTKTNRISRIFDSASRSAKRPAFISPKSQVVLCSILISIQLISTCIWMFLEPPGTRHYNPNGRRDVVILKCHIEDISFLISLVYNMILIVICTVYAVKTRRIPENFNESKFIGLTMYTTCVIWLAFVPIYFGTLNSFEVQVTTLCVSISLSASVTLVCLFGPKMYIIVFQPEKNVRKLTMNAHYKKNASGSGTFSSRENHVMCGAEALGLLIVPRSATAAARAAAAEKAQNQQNTTVNVNSSLCPTGSTEQLKLTPTGAGDQTRTVTGYTDTDTDLDLADRDSMPDSV